MFILKIILTSAFDTIFWQMTQRPSLLKLSKQYSKSFAMIIAYKATDCNPDIFFDHILNAIKVLDYESKEIYTIGDLNCDLLSHRLTDQPLH